VLLDGARVCILLLKLSLQSSSNCCTSQQHGIKYCVGQISSSGRAVSCRRRSKRSHHRQETKRSVHRAATGHLQAVPATTGRHPPTTSSMTSTSRTAICPTHAEAAAIMRQLGHWPIASLSISFYQPPFTRSSGLCSDAPVHSVSMQLVFRDIFRSLLHSPH